MRKWSRINTLAPIFSVVFALVISSCMLAAAQDTVMFWFTARDEVLPYYVEVIEEFEATYPNIKVDWTNLGGADNYKEIRIASLLAGIGPDVFFVWPGEDRNLAENGFIYDIDPLVHKDAQELDIEDFFPAQIAELQRDGKWWALPYDFSIRTPIYNTDLVDQYGLARPDSAWSWQDALEFGRRLTHVHADGRPASWGFDQWFGWEILAAAEGFVMTMGGRLFDDAYTRADAVNEGTIEALGILTAMGQQGSIPLPGQDGLGGFGGGRVGMHMAGSWWQPGYIADTISFPFDFATWPTGNDGRRVVSATGGAWAMNAATDNAPAAWTLLKWLASPLAAKKLVIDTDGSFPPRTSLLSEWVDHRAWLDLGDFTVFTRQIVDARVAPPVPFNTHQIMLPYREALHSGEISPEEAAVRIHHDLDVAFAHARGE